MSAFVNTDVSLTEEFDALEAAGRQRALPRRAAKGLKGAPQPTESQVQRAILNYVSRSHPAAMAWHVPNGLGGHTARQKIRRHREGVRAGVPDLTVCWPGGVTVFVEVKKPGGEVSEAQADRILRLRRMGFTAGIVASLDEAIALFRQAGVVR